MLKPTSTPAPPPDYTLLLQAEEELAKPAWGTVEEWNSLLIDYHPPTVWRLWRQWGAYRVLLHRIFACSEEAVLWHPHRWPSIVRIVQGGYWMRVGYGKGIVPPPCAARIRLSGNSIYVMDDPDAWHAVEPSADGSTHNLSLMVIGEPWAREMPVEPKAPLKSLSPGQARQLLSSIRRFY